MKTKTTYPVRVFCSKCRHIERGNWEGFYTEIKFICNAPGELKDTSNWLSLKYESQTLCANKNKNNDCPDFCAEEPMPDPGYTGPHNWEGILNLFRPWKWEKENQNET